VLTVSIKVSNLPCLLMIQLVHSRMEQRRRVEKTRLVLGYQLTTFLYLCASVYHFYTRGVTFLSVPYVMTGPFLVYGISDLLKDAAEHDRLSSDTYKRLNLALGLHALLGLSLPYLDSNVRTFFFLVPPILALINSIKGYSYGVLGWNKTPNQKNAVWNDILGGIKSTIIGMTRIKTADSVGYWAATVMIGTMALFQFVTKMQLITAAGWKGGDVTLRIASQISRLACLVLFTGTLYTLKDAADRKRLNGTSFIQLNISSFLAFAALAGYEYLNRPITWLGASYLVFSIISIVNAASSIIVRKTTEKGVISS